MQVEYIIRFLDYFCLILWDVQLEVSRKPRLKLKNGGPKHYK